MCFLFVVGFVFQFFRVWFAVFLWWKNFLGKTLVCQCAVCSSGTCRSVLVIQRSKTERKASAHGNTSEGPNYTAAVSKKRWHCPKNTHSTRSNPSIPPKKRKNKPLCKPVGKDTLKLSTVLRPSLYLDILALGNVTNKCCWRNAFSLTIILETDPFV